MHLPFRGCDIFRQRRRKRRKTRAHEPQVAGALPDLGYSDSGFWHEIPIPHTGRFDFCGATLPESNRRSPRKTRRVCGVPARRKRRHSLLRRNVSNDALFEVLHR